MGCGDGEATTSTSDCGGGVRKSIAAYGRLLWRRFGLADQQLLVWQLFLDPRFDLVELGEPGDRLGRQAGHLLGLDDLEEPSPRVGKTADLDHPSGLEDRLIADVGIHLEMPL